MDLEKTKRTETEKKRKKKTHTNIIGNIFKGQQFFSTSAVTSYIFAAILEIVAKVAILKESALIKLIITITKFSNLIGYQLIGSGTSCHPIRSVIIPVIKQIGLPLRSRLILLIT